MGGDLFSSLRRRRRLLQCEILGWEFSGYKPYFMIQMSFRKEEKALRSVLSVISHLSRFKL